MIVKTEKGWVALRKDQFSFKVIGTFSNRKAAEDAAKAAIRIDDGKDHQIRTLFWEEE